MNIYRITHNLNRYFGLRADLEESLEEALFNGESVIDRWVPPSKFDVIKGRVGDFVGAPFMWCCDLALNARAREVLAPHLKGVELLPFVYQKEEFWCIYIPGGADCLDVKKCTYWGKGRDPDDVMDVMFKPAKLPKRPIFRVRGGNYYYCNDVFLNAITEAKLRGSQFWLVWSNGKSQSLSGAEPIQPAVTDDKPIHGKRPGRRSKRDRLLERFWTDVIDRRGSDEWLDELLATPDKTLATSDKPEGGAFPFLADPARLLRAALKRKLTRPEILRLTRGLAYGVAFDVLTALEEESADTGPTLSALHEELLMANPKGDR